MLLKDYALAAVTGPLRFSQVDRFPAKCVTSSAQRYRQLQLSQATSTGRTRSGVRPGPSQAVLDLVDQHDNEPDTAHAVFDDQVLAVQARDLVVPGPALLHREEPRMFHRDVLDVQPVE